MDELCQVLNRHREGPERKDPGVHNSDRCILFDSRHASHKADHCHSGNAGKQGAQQHRTDMCFHIEQQLHQQVTSNNAGQHRVRDRIGKERQSPQDNETPHDAAHQRHQRSDHQRLYQMPIGQVKFREPFHHRRFPPAESSASRERPVTSFNATSIDLFVRAAKTRSLPS